jgi:hypothetical protein
MSFAMPSNQTLKRAYQAFKVLQNLLGSNDSRLAILPREEPGRGLFGALF